jgi:integrase
MKAGGERRFIMPLLHHFKNTPLVDINQDAIDHAADTLYPNASAATRNRQVYSPISAILKRAGIEQTIRRPKGSQGRELTHWLQPEQAFRLFREADKIDRQFGLFLRFLCYTGERLTSALRITVQEIEFSQSMAYIRRGKNGKPRAVYLPPDLVKRMKAHPKGLQREGKFFTFSKSGYLYDMLDEACLAAQISLPPRVAFHVFCHTWATWMRRDAGMDARGLVGTDRWKDIKSTFRYTHVVVSEESRKAALLPVEKKRRA